MACSDCRAAWETDRQIDHYLRQEWHWSQVPPVLQAMGLVLFVCSLVGIIVTMRANRFLSPVIRFQAERDQTVIFTGPYHYIRHPLYATAALFYLGVPGLACCALPFLSV